MNACISPRNLRLALALSVALLLAPSTCRAGLLPLTFVSGAPVVSGSNGSLTYNASTGEFNTTLTGSSIEYAAPFVLPRGFSLFSGTLTIDLKVDQNGNFVASGTGVTLTGDVSINGAIFNGTLLTGTITAFGAQAAGPPTLTFDGLFTITGGLLTGTETGTGGSPVFGGYPLESSGGFLLSVENVTSGTLGNFASNFSSSSVKPSVGVAVPEPSALVLLLTSVVALAGWGKVQTGRQLLARMRTRAL